MKVKTEIHLKLYRVKYKVVHEKEFWVTDQAQIESVLSEMNACEIMEIEEIPPFDEVIEVEKDLS